MVVVCHDGGGEYIGTYVGARVFAETIRRIQHRAGWNIVGVKVVRWTTKAKG